MDPKYLIWIGTCLIPLSLGSGCSVYDRVERLEETTLALEAQMAQQEKHYEDQLDAARARFSEEADRLRFLVERRASELTDSWTKFENAYSPAMRKALQANLDRSIEVRRKIEGLEKQSLVLLQKIADYEKESKDLRQTVANHELEARRDNQIVALRAAVKRIGQLAREMDARSRQMASALSDSQDSANSAAEASRLSLANSESARINSQLALENSQSAQKEAETARQFAAAVTEYSDEINSIRVNGEALRTELSRMNQQSNRRFRAFDDSLGRRHRNIFRNRTVSDWIINLDARLTKAKHQNNEIQALHKKLAILKKRVNTFHSGNSSVKN